MTNHALVFKILNSIADHLEQTDAKDEKQIDDVIKELECVDRISDILTKRDEYADTLLLLMQETL